MPGSTGELCREAPALGARLPVCEVSPLTSAPLRETLLLGPDQSHCVVDPGPVRAPLHPGGPLVNIRQVLHVPVIGSRLLPRARVPPRPPVLGQGLEQRGEDAAVRVREAARAAQRAGGSRRGGPDRRAAAGDQRQQAGRAEEAKDSRSRHLLFHCKQRKQSEVSGGGGGGAKARAAADQHAQVLAITHIASCGEETRRSHSDSSHTAGLTVLIDSAVQMS